MDLTPYLNMLPTMSDEDIATASGATVEAVAAFRAEQAAPPVAETPKPARASRAAKTAPPEPAETPALVESAPASVRVTKSDPGVRLANTPPGRGIRFRDVYSGEHARWLWEHKRGHVEPFPPGK